MNTKELSEIIKNNDVGIIVLAIVRKTGTTYRSAPTFSCKQGKSEREDEPIMWLPEVFIDEQEAACAVVEFVNNCRRSTG